MTASRLLPLLVLVALFVALTPLLVPGQVSASGLLAVEVAAAGPAAPGATLAVTVRATGADAELAPLEFGVEGGAIQGTLALAAVAPGVAEATVFVRRDTAGEALLSVRMAGTVVASRALRFAQEAPLQVAVALEGGPAASARTWRFEVVDASGALVDTVEVSMSGDQPAAAVPTRPLPPGAYTVRQLLGSDTATACDGSAFYATSGASVPVTVGAGAAVARVTITVCDEAPDDLGVSIPIDTVGGAPATDVPGSINEIRGVRTPGDGPLPPATGSGRAAAAPPGALAVPAALALLALGLPGALLAARSLSGRRD